MLLVWKNLGKSEAWAKISHLYGKATGNSLGGLWIFDGKGPQGIIKVWKAIYKERILKGEREKQSVTYKGTPIRLLVDLSKDTLQVIRDWQEIFKVMKSKDLQSRLFYPAKLSFRIEGQIKNFWDNKKLKSFITTERVLYEILIRKDLIRSLGKSRERL